MSKTTKKITANSVFLAAVLVAGIIALAYPSFMVGAQAQQSNGMDQRYNSYEQDYGTDNKYNSYEPEYGTDNKYNSYEPEYGTDYGMDSYGDKKPYGKDNSYDKSKDSSVIVKKVKCNNINVNLNGFSGNDIGTAPGLSALATDAQAEGEDAYGANFGNDRRGGDDDRSSGHDSNSRYECINNNNNGKEDGDDERECVNCFLDNLNDMQKRTLKAELTKGIDIRIGDRTIEINSLHELCTQLESAEPSEIVTAVSVVLKTIDLPLLEINKITRCIGGVLQVDLPIPSV